MSLHTGTSVCQLPESDTTSSVTQGAQTSDGTAAQSQNQPSVKPYGSAAARFKIRSAKTLTTKDLRKKSFSFESGNVEDLSQKNPSKDLNKVCTSASYTHTNIDETGKTLSKDVRMDSTPLISSEKSHVSDKSLITQADKTASDRNRGDELRRFYQSNKSKSLDWRAMNSKAGLGNTTVMTSGTRDYSHYMTRSDSSEKAETNNITSSTQENQPITYSRRIQAYNVANDGDQSSDRKVSPVSGYTSLRMNQINFAIEKASNGQSLPSRLKPRRSLDSIEDCGSLWAQQPGESSLGQTDKRIGFWTREQGLSNAEEVTGNQTIKERIDKLLGSHGKSDALSPDISFSKSMDTVDSTPSQRKNTTNPSDYIHSQQDKPSDNAEKAGTFPRRFSTTYFGPKPELSLNNDNRNDQRENPSGLSSSLSSKPKWSTESYKNTQSLLHDDNKESSKRVLTGSPKYCSQSLERTRSKLSATSQYSINRNQSAYSDSNSNTPNKDLNCLSSRIKEDILKDKQPDKETIKGLDMKENRCQGGSQVETTQPKNPLSSKAHSDVDKDGKDSVFTFKTEGRRGEGVLEKFRAQSMDSVKNTISMFESLAQQGTPKDLYSKRTLSVPEHPKPAALVRKSGSERNLHFGRSVGNRESPRTNFFNKNESNKQTEEGTLSKAPHSNSSVRVTPTFEPRQETYRKSVELVPEFKQMNESRTDRVSRQNDDVESRTAGKKHSDEPDSAIHVYSELRKFRATEEKVERPEFSQHSKRLLKQQTIHVKTEDDGDDEDEDTPINSPNSAPSTISMEKQSNTGVVKVNGTHPKVLPNQPQSSSHFQSIYSSLNHSNNNNYKIREDLTPLTTARWSSDEEDYDDEETDTDEDSDSGESSVTITSHMSQSERRSFSLSLMDLCNFGGVDYNSPDWLEDDEDLPSSRSASLSSDISVFSSVTLLSTDELDRLLDDVKSLGDDTLKKYEDVQVVVLHKEVGSGLGFTLAGGVDQNKPVTVHRIISGGVAAQEGSIFEGAQVLSINGTALQNSAHWEALRTLRKAKGQGMAVVVLQSGNSRKDVTEKTGITGRRVRVTLNKSSSDLGFSLEGGVGSSSGDKPLTIQKIFRGGPISEVFPGDELLEVQGRSLEGLMRLEAWNLIKKLPSGPVDILLHRPHQLH
ncbi:dentin sialophosphoprotein [Danio aesculapii]|uniref:dentin sialophosphoprotein n=1 Tax=Danio aesculapii TaxID=1142201 RepID=UPI0024C0B799|nr:dentin sialophosphoprotein [Danio aesculapii]XP_056331752.1 dentin sialophosphoprotein [Danio aesculapii]XP_056331753.1 dentin sialophosphoprotein [Danio aesculapii]